jgi:hypothetical protein
MRLGIAITLGLLALPASGQDPTPDAAGQQAVVARMRDAALTYSDRLQDFTCIQLSTRSAGPSPTGPHWKPLEKQESELSYVGHREHYKLLAVNGESTGLQKRIKQGPYATTGGEFGSALLKIFDPQARAEFVWDHRETSAPTHTCVFRYSVSPSTSTEVITADLDHVRVGHHGTVWADCDTGAVTHFRMETDRGEVHRHGIRVPLEFRLEVSYAPATIGSQEFLLPQTAEETTLFYKTWTKAEIQFQQYRKYDAHSTVKFDDGKN